MPSQGGGFEEKGHQGRTTLAPTHRDHVGGAHCVPLPQTGPRVGQSTSSACASSLRDLPLRKSEHVAQGKSPVPHQHPRVGARRRDRASHRARPSGLHQWVDARARPHRRRGIVRGQRPLEQDLERGAPSTRPGSVLRRRYGWLSAALGVQDPQPSVRRTDRQVTLSPVMSTARGGLRLFLVRSGHHEHALPPHRHHRY